LVDWPVVWREAARLAQTHAATVGCHSLDILHGALAKALRPRGSFHPIRGRSPSRVRQRCRCWRFEFLLVTKLPFGNALTRETLFRRRRTSPERQSLGAKGGRSAHVIARNAVRDA